MTLKDLSIYPQLALPPCSYRVELRKGKYFVYDENRTKWLMLTPEEWVRQHYVHYLIHFRGYPKHALANEVELPNSIRKGRCDTVIFGSKGKACAIVEYKAATLILNNTMWQQLLSYNLYYKVKLLCLSNGLKQVVCLLNNNEHNYQFLTEIPSYNELKQISN